MPHIANIFKKEKKWKLSFENKPKKSYTQVRVEDSIIVGLKDFIKSNNLNISYTKIINAATEMFLKDSSKKEIINLIKPQKKTYTPVRVEDEILEGLKNYTKDNNLKSHGVLINHICKKFLVDSGYIKE